MAETIRTSFPYITGGLFALALLSLLISLRLFRRSRTDVFWRQRRDAGQRGWRLFALSFALLILGGLSCAFTIFVSLVSDSDEVAPTPTQIAEQSGTLPPDLERSPTGTTEATPANPLPAETPTPEPPVTVIIVITTTPLVTPTPTPYPTFTPYVTPLASDVTPLPNAAIRITALDDQISDTFAPVNPRATFAAGITRIYLFVEFQGMSQGVMWRRALYRDGRLIDGGSYFWGQAAEGTTYFFFGNDNGFAPGNYEIRLFIGDSSAPTSVLSFAVVETP